MCSLIIIIEGRIKNESQIFMDQVPILTLRFRSNTEQSSNGSPSSSARETPDPSVQTSTIPPTSYLSITTKYPTGLNHTNATKGTPTVPTLVLTNGMIYARRHRTEYLKIPNDTRIAQSTNTPKYHSTIKPSKYSTQTNQTEYTIYSREYSTNATKT